MDTAYLTQRLQAAQDEINFVIGKLREPAKVTVVDTQLAVRKLVWGAKVDLQFKAGVLWIEDQLKINADFLMACMAFETGGTFSPSVKNAAGSSGTGLIQFMAATARSLGTTVDALAKLSALQQLSYVYKYFKGFRGDFSGCSLEDIYMFILFPKAVGKPLDWEMPWKYGSLAYKQNSGLDLNKDRKITKAEAAAGVRKRYDLGKQFMG